ncbi:transporter substrate-binding domain-containing protein [Sedimenticola hydrogenitrophicus]|uniref:transporter substrate-binding domain-containing protein n=1 Tax=Sedimenticola hydrogenitrophicus TaxID=2967975 RepID=UPI0021A3DD5D|nr:transporter substrate-binding domain-containing protein [Sedimenticola hydrogenitrophicus]
MPRHSERTQSWRVGVLFSQTGVTSVIEKTQLNGTLLAIEELNSAGGVLGRQIEPVIYDPASEPYRFRDLALQLTNVDKVNVIFGCYMSSTRKAVLPVVERHNALLFYPTLYEGFEFSPNVIYTGAAPNQNSVQLAHFLMESFGKRFYFVGSNYIYPYESNRIMRDLVRQSGGEIIDERYLPLDAVEEDFESVVVDIVKNQPDVIFSTVVGQATAHFYRAYARAGLNSDMIPIASLTTNEADIREMGAEVACGHYTSAPYFEGIETEENECFVARFRARFGADEPVTSGAEAAYFQVHLFAEALKKSGDIGTEVLRNELMGGEYSAPQGRVRIDPDNGHTYLWPRIARVDANGRFVVVATTSSAVKPDPYLVSPQVNDWSLRQFKIMQTAPHMANRSKLK